MNRYSTWLFQWKIFPHMVFKIIPERIKFLMQRFFHQFLPLFFHII